MRRQNCAVALAPCCSALFTPTPSSRLAAPPRNGWLSVLLSTSKGAYLGRATKRASELRIETRLTACLRNASSKRSACFTNRQQATAARLQPGPCEPMVRQTFHCWCSLIIVSKRPHFTTLSFTLHLPSRLLRPALCSPLSHVPIHTSIVFLIRVIPRGFVVIVPRDCLRVLLLTFFYCYDSQTFFTTLTTALTAFIAAGWHPHSNTLPLIHYLQARPFGPIDGHHVFRSEPTLSLSGCTSISLRWRS